MLEKEIQHQILDYLNKLPNFFAWRNQSVGIYANGSYRKKGGFDIKGTSDIFAVRSPDGKLFCFEVKKDAKSKTSNEQKAFIKKINNIGGVAFVVWSLEQVKTILKLSELEKL